MPYHFLISIALVPIGIGVLLLLSTTLGSRRCAHCAQLLPRQYARSGMPCFSCGQSLNDAQAVYMLHLDEIHPVPDADDDSAGQTLSIVEVRKTPDDLPVLDAVRNGDAIISDTRPRSIRSAISQMTRLVTFVCGLLFGAIGAIFLLVLLSQILSGNVPRGGFNVGNLAGFIILAITMYALMWGMFVTSAVLIELLVCRRTIIYRDTIALLNGSAFASADVRDVTLKPASRLMKMLPMRGYEGELIMSTANGTFRENAAAYSTESAEFITTYIESIKQDEEAKRTRQAT